VAPAPGKGNYAAPAPALNLYGALRHWLRNAEIYSNFCLAYRNFTFPQICWGLSEGVKEKLDMFNG
jgi:hypothetical protein